jgi:hypothetical protein
VDAIIINAHEEFSPPKLGLNPKKLKVKARLQARQKSTRFIRDNDINRIKVRNSLSSSSLGLSKHPA